MTKRNLKIAKLINSLLCYSTMVHDTGRILQARIDANEAATAKELELIDNSMKWFNEAAKELIAMGIDVTLYGRR